MKTSIVDSIKIELDSVVEDTYVMSVLVDGVGFTVNCQTRVDHNYRELPALSCDNDSGGDIVDSGLTEYLSARGVDVYSEEYAQVCEKIEKNAESYLSENTIERVISEKIGVSIKGEKALFGAFGPTDVTHVKYILQDDKIVVASIDTSEPLAENSLLGHISFDSEKEYENWLYEIYGDSMYGDCSVSYRAWRSIVGEEL